MLQRGHDLSRGALIVLAAGRPTELLHRGLVLCLEHWVDQSVGRGVKPDDALVDEVKGCGPGEGLGDTAGRDESVGRHRGRGAPPRPPAVQAPVVEPRRKPEDLRGMFARCKPTTSRTRGQERVGG